MPIVNTKDRLHPITAATLERNVVGESLNPVKMHSSLYFEIIKKGVYTRGTFSRIDPNPAVAITNMGYCAGLVLTKGPNNDFTDYLAIHFYGSYKGIESFIEPVIMPWKENTPGDLHAFAAIGVVASTVSGEAEKFRSHIQRATGLHQNVFDIHIYAATLVVYRSGVVGTSSDPYHEIPEA